MGVQGRHLWLQVFMSAHSFEDYFSYVLIKYEEEDIKFIPENLVDRTL